MNRKQLLILVVLGVVLGLAGLVISNRRDASWSRTDGGESGKLFAEFPINDVAHIQIKQPTGEVNVVKSEGLWRVSERSNYPANFAEVSDLLRKMWNLEVIEEVTVGPSQYARLELTEPNAGQTNSGTRVEFKDQGGKTISGLLLGKKYMQQSAGGSIGGGFPIGRYVMTLQGDKRVALISDPLSDLEARAETWISKDFFKVEKPKRIAVTSANEGQSWVVQRESESGDWTLVEPREGETLDKSKVSGLNWAFSSPSFNDVVTPDSAEAQAAFASARTVSIDTFDGFAYAIEIGGTNSAGNHFLRVRVEANLPSEREAAPDEKPEDKERLDKEFKEKHDKLAEKLKKEEVVENWVYLVSKWTVDSVLKERKDLLAEPKKDEAETPADGATPVPSAPDVLDGTPDFLKPPVQNQLPPIPVPLAPPGALPEQSPQQNALQQDTPAAEPSAEPATTNPEADSAPVAEPDDGAEPEQEQGPEQQQEQEVAPEPESPQPES